MDTAKMDARELTREERAAIRTLVVKMCANYDHDYGCLPLDCPCYMLNKWWTGAYCKYFRAAVLPLDPVLEAALTETAKPETKSCALCGKPFATGGKRAYCSPACQKEANRRKSRELIRAKRNAGPNV